MWKRELITHYEKKEKHIICLAKEDPERAANDWGFVRMPSRVCPVNDVFIEWIYVIDLELDIFRVSDYNNDTPLDPGRYGTQYFRLYSIPRDLFEDDAIEAAGLRYPVMGDTIPAEHFFEDEIPASDPVLLTFYQSFSPVPTPTFDPPSGTRQPSWHKLQLALLEEFVQYFMHSFRDTCPSRTSSPFVFQQLAYAVLSLTSYSGIKFHRTTSEYMLHADKIDTMYHTPSWDPPASDTYWLNDILIVLNQNLSTNENGDPSPSTQASLARASQLAPAAPTIAVIFSVHAIMLVHIAPDTPITHTAALPLLTIDPATTPFSDEAIACLASVSFETPGILALIDLFTRHPRVPLYPAVSAARLPAELCRMVFHYADESTQAALEATCRMFRAVAVEYPRLGGRTLKKWGKQEVLGFGGAEKYGWELGLWGTEKLNVNMPLVRVVEE